jgi:superfamily I DNA/RNA helicase
MDYLKFSNESKNILIAPAGYGKTYTISECLKYTEGKQLILTHTNVGISAIKAKLVKNQIESKNYQIETISSFAQKYVLAYYYGEDLPLQSNTNDYYPFIIKRATLLFDSPLVKQIFQTSYRGLFVDEYQDCTESQHNLILKLSSLLPTHLLGDPLQGIFGFDNDKLINLDDHQSMGDFLLSKHELTNPWRWTLNNQKLGENLKSIRNKLESRSTIILSEFPAIVTNIINEKELYQPKSDYNKKIWNELSRGNLLIIEPESGSTAPRTTFISRFKSNIYLLESIDDKDFYKLASKLDEFNKDNFDEYLFELALKIFNSKLKNWLGKRGLVSKKDKDQNQKLEPLRKLYNGNNQYNKSKLAKILRELKKLPGIRCYRIDLFFSLCSALEIADKNEISVMEAMEIQRNFKRRIGRTVYGKNIGTTLLTKGLEFENVVILNAHKFKCEKNFYVAITRASKRLVIFSKTNEISPYNNVKKKKKVTKNNNTEIQLKLEI